MSVQTCERCGGYHYGSLCRDDAGYQDDPGLLKQVIARLVNAGQALYMNHCGAEGNPKKDCKDCKAWVAARDNK